MSLVHRSIPPFLLRSLTASACMALAALAKAQSVPADAPETVLPVVNVKAAAPLPVEQERGYRAKRSAASGFREKAVVDTPFSVSSFSADVMQDQQAKTVADVIRNDPSVTLANDPSYYDRVMVRGFYLGVSAVQRDGLSINDQGTIALENKAAVELSKGLSALRYGLTSPGGVINYVVKRPTAEPLSRATLSANGFGGYGAQLDLSRRFGDHQQFGLRVNAAGEELRTYQDDFEGDRKFLSALFDWQVTDKLAVELDLEHQRGRKSAPGSPNIFWWNSVAEARAAFPGLSAKTFVSQPWATEPNEQNYVAGRAVYRLDAGWKATVAAQRSRLTRDQRSVSPGALQPNGDYTAELYDSPSQARNNNAFQAVIDGDVRTGSIRHELAFGFDALRRDMTYGDGFSGPIGTGNLFTRPVIAEPPVTTNPSYLANRTNQTSWFVTDTLVLSDQFQVFGGLRRTRIDIRNGSGTAPMTHDYEKFVVNPSVGVLFKPAANLSVYASYAEGIEQGGTAPDDAANAREVMKPLTSKQYEVGTKVEMGEDALLTAAIFHIDKGLEYTDASNTYVQDGSQVHEGVELTLNGRVGKRLRLLSGVAYLKARVEETSDTALIGKRPQGVPQWQANLFADYDLSAMVQGLSLNGGVFYGGKKAIDADNTWMADAWTRFDAGARYRQQVDGRELVYRLAIENLADKRYLASTNGGALTFGSTRAVKASVTLDF